MPATPIYGIVYPCSGETIDPSVLADFARSLDAALAQGTSDLARVTNRPNAQMTATASQLVAINTTTSLTFATEVYDNDTMIDLAASTTVLTVRTAGAYLVWGSYRMTSGFATLTSTVVIITVNGVEVAREVTTTSDLEFGVTVPLNLLVGDTVGLQARWNGTGGPASITTRLLSASYVAAPTA